MSKYDSTAILSVIYCLFLQLYFPAEVTASIRLCNLAKHLICIHAPLPILLIQIGLASRGKLSRMEYLQPLRISALAVFRRTPLIVLYLAVETPIQQLSLKLILTLQIKHLLIKCFTPFQDESKLLHL